MVGDRRFEPPTRAIALAGQTSLRFRTGSLCSERRERTEPALSGLCSATSQSSILKRAISVTLPKVPVLTKQNRRIPGTEEKNPELTIRWRQAQSTLPRYAVHTRS